ncbi:MAG TPA: hypothetical protein VHF27_14380 [Acidimicrobiales bacterium]|nr:hypothetical protein [Acidimicrobiales bacterium]
MAKRAVRVVAMAMVAGAVASVTLAAPARAGTVSGAACAYRISLSLFGGPATVRGCGQTVPPGGPGSASPHVTLPPGGSAAPIVAFDPDGARGVYGPAVVFGGRFQADGSVPPSGPLFAQTVGTTTVQSTALATFVGPQPFYARSVLASCTASARGSTFTTQLVDAVVVTSTDRFGNPTSSVPVPSTPPVGFTVPFVIDNVGDHGVVVFNERVANPDGSTTLNAVHMYMQGPIAVGDMVVGQVRCGR